MSEDPEKLSSNNTTMIHHDTAHYHSYFTDQNDECDMNMNTVKSFVRFDYDFENGSSQAGNHAEFPFFAWETLCAGPRFIKPAINNNVRNFYDKSALNQSNAMISVPYNSYCPLLWIKHFVKQGPEQCLHSDTLLFDFYK